MEINGLDYRTGQPIRLEVDGSVLAGVFPLLSVSTPENLPYIAPGLIDLQVNGYAGIDFNTLPITENAVKQLTQRLWQEGVTEFFPTVITNSETNIAEVLRQIVRACKANGEVEQSVAGIHLEGPFISPDDGPRGAHDRAFVIAPDFDLLLRWQDCAEGKIRLITISPEWPDSSSFIERCVNAGVRVAIGHTAATDKQIQEAVAAGASLSTHLGNAAHQMLPRRTNYIWEQLAEENLWASLIADGFHLSDAVLKVFLKVKDGKCFLISDSTQFAGMQPGLYKSSIGGEVELAEDGRLFIRRDPGFLAGSAKSLLWGVNTVLQKGLLPLQMAWDMASLKPRAFLERKEAEAFRPGEPADYVLFYRTGAGVQVSQTIKSGRRVY